MNHLKLVNSIPGVNMFGDVSSGACSSYALKMTAIENKEKFGEEAAQSLQNTVMWTTCQSQCKIKKCQFI